MIQRHNLQKRKQRIGRTRLRLLKNHQVRKARNATQIRKAYNSAQDELKNNTWCQKPKYPASIQQTNITGLGFMYRLGDMVLLRREQMNPKCGYNYHKMHFPNSLATEYMKQTKHLPTKRQMGNVRILRKLLQARRKQIKDLPTRNEAVIHCRVGDVIDLDPHSVEQFLAQKCNTYVKPQRFYENIISMIKIKHPQILKITIVAGFHLVGDHTKSLDYLDKVQAIFTKHGFVANLRLNNQADDDFMYMTHSHLFVPSGGGFSRLTAKMVKALGGVVLT